MMPPAEMLSSCGASMRGPAPVDRQCDAGDRRCGVTRQEHCERADLFDRGEALVRLLGEQDVADDLLARNAVRLGLAFDLLLDQRRIAVTSAARGAGAACLGDLEGDELSAAQDD